MKSVHRVHRVSDRKSLSHLNTLFQHSISLSIIIK